MGSSWKWLEDGYMFIHRNRTVHRLLTAKFLLKVWGTWILALVMKSRCGEKSRSIPALHMEAVLVLRVLVDQFIDSSSLLCHKHCHCHKPWPQALSLWIQFRCLNLDVYLWCASISCLASRKPWFSIGPVYYLPALCMSCTPQTIPEPYS